MSAVFTATGVFALPARKLSVIHGAIASGTVRKGMQMRVGLNSSMGIALPVDAVEFVLKSGKEEVALCTRYESDDELAMLQGLNIEAEEIQVSDPEEAH